jgi:VTC domain-containing protein
MADSDRAGVPSPDFTLTRPRGLEPEAGTQFFGRYEIKYLVSSRLAGEIEKDVSRFMELDPFCRDQPTHDYLVRSLYFDDATLTAYYEKLDGIANRSKYRLRAYGAGEMAPCFLEVKGRANNFSYKHRTLLSRHLRTRLSAQDWGWVLRNATDADMVARFTMHALRKTLRPNVIVEYTRRPYISARDYRFRVTFDRRIVATRSTTLDARSGGRHRVLPDQAVLEIKFERSVPTWFQRLIGAYELQRISVSKYCRALEVLGFVPS